MMNKNLILIFTLLFCINAKAQLSEGGMPVSKNLETKGILNLKVFKAKKINLAKASKEDKKNKIDNRYAITEKVNINLKDKATKQIIKEGCIWLYKIQVENAMSIGLVFNYFEIPEGAKLFLRNNNYTQIQGAYTYKNNKEYKKFSISDFKGSEVILEYFEPNNTEFSGKLILGKIIKAYKDIFKTSTNSKSENFININCYEGDNYQLEKHSVAKMTYNGYLCSGALINNVKNDATNYFLTANHCISDNETAQELITFFNYELPDCNAGAVQTKTLSGATLKTTSSKTDVTLLLLDKTPPPSYQPYYAGWNAKSDSVVTSGFGIHHPAGKPKKVSITRTEIISLPEPVTWENNFISEPNTHWLCFFTLGQTAGGSSGSPLFDENKRIIGQLHGGSDVHNLYGKLSLSWKHLKKYLDPENTGKLRIDGHIPANNEIDAFAFTDFNNICTGADVQLKNGSLFGATTFNWSIKPNTYKFTNGTNANSENPIVNFEEEEEYTISLEATGNGKTDRHIRSNYVSTKGINLKLYNNPFYKDCIYDFEKTYIVEGANKIEPQITKGFNMFEVDYEKTKNNIIVVKKKQNATYNTSFQGQLEITGKVGNCFNKITENLQMHVVQNDSIKNAKELKIGYNGMFSNICATAEENEPHPPVGNNKCTTLGYWCSCDAPEIPTVNNSVWFYFIATETGVVSLKVKGEKMDPQIALYEAENYKDIISGDKNKYKIIAANDDYKTNLPYSVLDTIRVIPNKKYWLQVDGSACGMQGEFFVTLLDKIPQNAIKSNNKNNETLVYPNPTNHYFNIKQQEIVNNAIVELINIQGKVINVYKEDILLPNVKYQFSIPNNTKGLHTINIKERGKIIYSKKIIIE